jgi:CheY-like chemotaxis protein
MSTHPEGMAMTADARQPHILVVDDTQETRELLQDLLEGEGYRVTTAPALLDIAQIKALAPDILIQDIPFEHSQEQGWTLLSLLRLDPELARLPVVLSTTAVRTVRHPEMAAHLERLGVRVVLKPFRLDQLLGALTEALANRTTTEQQHFLSTLLRDVATGAKAEPAA